jgi:hypothetical protein
MVFPIEINSKMRDEFLNIEVFTTLNYQPQVSLNVAFRSSTGLLVYVQTSHVGQMATRVNASSMPAEAWWNVFYIDYYDAVSD